MRAITFYNVQIQPLQPMIDWLHNLNIQDEAYLGSHNYVLPRFLPSRMHQPTKEAGFFQKDLASITSKKEAEDFLRENYQDLLINDFNQRCAGQRELPILLDWEDFNRWFSWNTYRVRVDKKTGKVLEWTADEDRTDRFDFYDDLLNEQGEFDSQKADDWLLSLYERLRFSPENDVYRQESGQYIYRNFEALFLYLFKTKKKTISQLEVADLEHFLKEHIPLETVTRGLHTKTLIYELFALFKYLERVFALEGAPQFLEYLRTPGLSEEIYRLIQKYSIWNTSTDLDDKVAARIAKRKENRVPQTPYVDQGATPGRNDPCSCGSGLKYKQCCMRNK